VDPVTTAVGPLALLGMLTAALCLLYLTRTRRRRRAALGVLAACAVAITPMAAANAASAPQRPLATQDFEPMATEAIPNFILTPDDLEFIYLQIQIAEAHSYAMKTGDQGYSLLCASRDDTTGKCVRDPMLPHGLRTVDGSFNNLEFNTEWGKSNRLMPRMLPADFRDAEPGPGGGPQTSYQQTAGVVFDSHAREVSNLIADQSANNPAAIAAFEDNPDAEYDPIRNEYYLPNRTPDEELSAPVNMWFVFFGQFFDHGLDLVNKGGSGTIIVPLHPDDPLYEPGADTNFMVLDRATNQVDEDGNIIREHENRTTPYVDQNQTYTSHPSHQVFLREYELLDENGNPCTGGEGCRPVDTGRLLDGANGGLATWNDVKRQAREVLGIDLTDVDVLNVPQVYVDYYGNFIPGENGFPQLMLVGDDAGMTEGNLVNPISTENAIDLNQSFLDDIAHGAVPDEIAGYDNVALGEHFITGDGRGNENIGLTAVHHVFHSEHNRLVEQINDTLDDNPELKAKYQGTGQWAEPDNWNYNQRVFQAARFGNEMQYQHLVFEEYARTITPGIDVVVFNENSYDSTIDASIKAEFAHVVYRFGHSMLTPTIERELGGASAPSGGVEDMPLLDGFLNPVAFHCAVQPSGENTCPAGMELSPEDAAGAIVNGTVRQPANQIDELITSTLRNNLLGLPLDLATINILRGRDVGMPSLNEARRVFYEETGEPNLRPYDSWFDFDVELRNGNNFGRPQIDPVTDEPINGSASLVNFVAAYGTHPELQAATTLEEKRIIAELLVYGDTVLDYVSRIAGENRYETAAAISNSRYTGEVPVVYVAVGNDFPDALAGGPAAAADGAPLLLVAPNAIPPATVLELIKLKPEQIKILGGPSAVSQQVANSLGFYAKNGPAGVTRMFGADRYGTAAAVSKAAYPSGTETVFIASGRDFPDALVAGSVASSHQAPILLTQPGGLPAATRNELARLKPSKVIILGGPVAVSAAVENQLKSIVGTSGTVTRIGGANRYETAIEVTKAMFPANTGGTLYVTTGRNFPDALSASAVAGITGAAAVAGEKSQPILLVPGDSALPANVAAEILRLNPDRVVVVGGPVAVNQATEDALEALFEQPPTIPDREEFMNSTGAWENQETGVNNVDFWIGGLAERVDTFGNMLGPTFSYVFEKQLEDLQFGDRFYYLFRNQGEDLFASLENNSFSSLIQRNTNASLIPAEVFLANDLVFDLENLPNPLPRNLRALPNNGGYQYDGDEHIEIHGFRTQADRIIGGEGDDNLWGYGGNDRIEGRAGVDTILGGEGDDILTDSHGDDNIKGQNGNDAINGGQGIDLLLGGEGNDFVMKTQDNSGGATAFLGRGNDMFLGGTGRDNPFGGPGDDWIEGGPHADLVMGDRAQQFQDDVKGGDDILIGGDGSDDHDAEGGMDIMVGGIGGTDRYHGMFGFDWVTYDGAQLGVDADLNFNLLQLPDVTAIRDRYLQVEALSGGSHDDVIRGLGVSPDEFANDNLNKLEEEKLAKIEGLEDLLRPANATQDYAQRVLINPLEPDNDGVSNILLGGAGNDIIEGRFGDDFIDGDAVLRVRLVYNGQEYSSLSQLQAGVFAGTINPGEITHVRKIAVEPGAETDVDTAVFFDPYYVSEGECVEFPERTTAYDVTWLHDDYYEVVHRCGPEFEESEGQDVINRIEQLTFGDGSCFELARPESGIRGDAAQLTPCPVQGFVTFEGQTDPPTEDEAIIATVHFEDEEGNPTVQNPTNIRFNWQAGEAGEAWDPSSTGDNIPDAPNGRVDTFYPGDGDTGAILRVVVTYKDDDGVLRQIVSPVVGTPDENGEYPTVVGVNDDPYGLTIRPLNPRVGNGILPSVFIDPDGLEEAWEAGIQYIWERSLDGGPWQVVATKITPDDTQLGYMVQEGDVGYNIRLRVVYEDDAGFENEIISEATQPVQPAVGG